MNTILANAIIEITCLGGFLLHWPALSGPVELVLFYSAWIVVHKIIIDGEGSPFIVALSRFHL